MWASVACRSFITRSSPTFWVGSGGAQFCRGRPNLRQATGCPPRPGRVQPRRPGVGTRLHKPWIPGVTPHRDHSQRAQDGHQNAKNRGGGQVSAMGWARPCVPTTGSCTGAGQTPARCVRGGTFLNAIGGYSTPYCSRYRATFRPTAVAEAIKKGRSVATTALHFQLFKKTYWSERDIVVHVIKAA